MDFNRNARFALITAVIASLLALVYYLALFFLLDEKRYLVTGGATLILLLVAAGGLLQLRAGRPRAAVWMLILGGELTFLVPVIVFANGSFLFAPAIVLLVLLIALLTFSQPQERNRAAYSAMISAAVHLLADQFWSLQRVPLPAPVIVGIGGLIAAVTLLYTVFFFRTFSELNLRAKTTALVAALVILTVALVSTLHILYTRNTLLNNAQNSLYNAAESLADRLDSSLAAILNGLRAEVQNPDFAEMLTVFPQSSAYADALKETSTTLLALKNKDVIFISSYALLDAQGKVLVSTEEYELGQDESQRDYFQKPRQDGLPFFSVWYAENSLYFSAPVRDKNNVIVGVLRARYSASLLQQLIVQSGGLAGEESFAVLLDENRLILAHGRYPQTIFKSIAPLDADVLAGWQKEGRYPPGTAEMFTLNLPEVEQGLKQAASSPFFELTDVQNIRQQTVAVPLKQQPWVVLFAQPQQVFLAPINQQINRSILLALAAAILSAYLSIGVSRLLTDPILRLTETARQIAAGDLAQQTAVTSRDEIGTLAEAFNQTTSQLRGLITSLEQRVSERTMDLKNAVIISEKRARDLQAISEISRLISTEQRLDTLLPLVAHLISERFGFYHAGIFLVDEARRFAHLQAANSEGGQKMLARGHRLPIGTGLVGTAVQTGKPRIALDVGADPVYFNNPDLPNTHSEMALPLNYRGVTIGVLDVQSTQPGAFTESDANTLSILADQVAVAIENARLFGQIQQAREEAETLYTQIQRREWSVFLRPETRIGYQQTVSGGKRLTQPVLSAEIRKALQQGQVVVTAGEETNAHPSMAVPVKLRGQTLGVIRIQAPLPNHRWSQDEINLAQAISDRLALALDNARLLLEAQRRAAKEAKIGEVSAKIGASINMRNVLQTAVEELGRALPGSEVIIQFGGTDGEGIE